MLIIGTFKHSIELEQALAVLEHSDIPRNHIMVVPMDADPVISDQYIDKSRDRYYKGIEVGMALATASCVIGISAGFVLPWGPIVWAIITAVAGYSLGFGIYVLAHQGSLRHIPQRLPEITVIVQCPEDKSILVKGIMWKYRAFSVGQVQKPSGE